jgi:hypothetical protein
VDGGVVAVDSAAEDGNGLTARLERTAVRLAVDAARHPADDDQPGAGELAPEHARDVRAVGGAGAGADDRHRRPREQPDQRPAANEQAGRRVENRGKRRREAVVRPSDPAEAGGGQARPQAGLVETSREPTEAGVARGEYVPAGLGRVRSECKLADAFGVTTSPRTETDSFAVASVLGFGSHVPSSSRGER